MSRESSCFHDPHQDREATKEIFFLKMLEIFEFMSKMAHISGEYRFRSLVFAQMQKFRNLFHKRVIFSKMWVLGFKDTAS